MQMQELQENIHRGPLNRNINNMKQLQELKDGYPKNYKYYGDDNDTENVSIYELEDENLIERVRHLLAGEVYDPHEGEWVKHPDVKPPMNSKGVHYFMIKFGGHLDKNIKLSHFDQKKINEMMVEICNSILKIFWYYDSDFEIRLADMNMIINLLEHNIYANYMRALNGGERKHRETLIKLHETSVEKTTDSGVPKSSFFSGFSPFKNKQVEGGNSGL